MSKNEHHGAGMGQMMTRVTGESSAVKGLAMIKSRNSQPAKLSMTIDVTGHHNDTSAKCHAAGVRRQSSDEDLPAINDAYQHRTASHKGRFKPRPVILANRRRSMA